LGWIDVNCDRRKTFETALVASGCQASMQCLSIRREHFYVPPMLAGKASEWARGSGVDAPSGLDALKSLLKALGVTAGGLHIHMLHNAAGEPGARWELGPLSLLELGCSERIEVFFGRERNSRVVSGAGLNDDLAALASTAASARDLGHKLKRAFGGAEIGNVQ
jgi:hypothetical protein